MQKSIFFTFCLLLTFGQLSAQNIKVQPYLQAATPNSIRIMWETDAEEESIVEWGLTDTLGNATSGISFINNGTAMIHDVQLTGLTRFTVYYYRVKTGAAVSTISQFKTPPFASDNEPFRIVAMSDMQKDGNNPNKFLEIVEDGILSHLEAEAGGELYDNLAMVLIPGDLVENGNNYSQWEEHFFTPAQSLFSQVPVYPVLGNHEVNTMYYFNYFHLPENGIEGLEERSWHHDYGNLRVIGLDSNGPYNTQEQLDWLDTVLASTCENEDIDFVFAELHHPHKSELWLPGESNFTGDVISRLENFTADCGKPSIHFFGHTHAYSRGQSRDDKHLWINVATAGGAIDNWGEFPNADYPEFSKSFDDWGFVTVDITTGEAPEFTVKRYSRGNDAFFRDNELRDSFTIKLQDELVQKPTAIFPTSENVNPDCVILKANDFAAENTNALHGQSHWQIFTDCENLSSPVIERWKNYENLYFDIDTQAEDDLTDEKIIDLEENTNYCWRVRYRDRALNWSEWSAISPFSTGQTSSTASDNLLFNPDAEGGIEGWTAIEGVIEALGDNECAAIAPHSGKKSFAVGGVCEDHPYGKSIQDVDVIAYADSIDTGNWQVNFGGYLSDWNGADLPELKIIIYHENGVILAESNTFSNQTATWVLTNEWLDIPIGTRRIQFVLEGTRNGGSDNDSYFDDLFLRLGHQYDACDEFVVNTSNPNIVLPNLNVNPNPFSSTASINLPKGNYKDLNVEIRNILGQKTEVPVDIFNDKVVIHRGNLSKGVYFFLINDENVPIGKGKFLVHF